MTKRIVVFEGWLMGKDAYVSKMLRSIGVNNFEGHAFNEVVKHPGVPTAWLGHSLGGDKALQNGREGDIVITFDPRWQNGASYFDFFIPFQSAFQHAPGVTCYNFYRNFGLLPGYPVKGAINTKLPWYVQHASVPGHPLVLAKVRELLK
jgi:hypothetical protein